MPIPTAEDLDRALAGDHDGAYSFEAEDGRYTISLRRVVYVKRLGPREPGRLRRGRLGRRCTAPRLGAPGARGTRPRMSEAATQKKESETKRVRALVERAQQGDRAALEELYLIHFDRIYSYLHVSVGNRHDAEDLTTQTFLKMLESIGKFRWQSAPFSAWLFRIAHNLAMDHFRANRRWQPEEEVPEPEPDESTSAEAGRARVDRAASRCSS